VGRFSWWASLPQEITFTKLNHADSHPRLDSHYALASEAIMSLHLLVMLWEASVGEPVYQKNSPPQNWTMLTSTIWQPLHSCFGSHNESASTSHAVGRFSWWASLPQDLITTKQNHANSYPRFEWDSYSRSYVWCDWNNYILLYNYTISALRTVHLLMHI